jgi:hypothetical protein
VLAGWQLNKRKLHVGHPCAPRGLNGAIAYAGAPGGSVGDSCTAHDRCRQGVKTYILITSIIYPLHVQPGIVALKPLTALSGGPGECAGLSRFLS